MDPPSASTQALSDTDDYLSFDPRAGRSARPTAASNRGRQTFAEAIVFVVGGGSYVEYGNLGEWAGRNSVPGVNGTIGAVGVGGAGGKKITYGATEILPPAEFLKSLGALARAAM